MNLDQKKTNLHENVFLFYETASTAWTFDTCFLCDRLLPYTSLQLTIVGNDIKIVILPFQPSILLNV